MDAVDAAVAALYAAVSFPRGSRPDLERLRACFLPGARLVHVKPEGPDAMDAETFVARLDEHVRAGDLLAVDEREVAARTEVFGGIAMRFSTFEGRFEGPGGIVQVRGVNAISLVREGASWRIASIVWDEERRDPCR